MGFFTKSELLASKAPVSRLPHCGSCGLMKQCQSPKMPINGHGKRKILLVGEAPGAEEDKRNKPFVGVTGQLLEITLRKYGINMREDCWITNSLICRPPENREPKEKEIDYCRPNIVNAIEKYNPEIIVPIGGAAIKSVVGWLWKDSIGQVGRWAGWRIPDQKTNAWVCPIWHPSYISRNDPNKRDGKVLRVIWEREIDAISKLEGRPWDKVPNFQSQVRVMLDPDEATEEIYNIVSAGGTAAFDYETNSLKPEWEDSHIVCCSICHEGENTIAFPWTGRVIKAMKFFLNSNIRKIASNIKFEDRWSKAIGTPVKDWWWCTMTGAHIMDNRRQIASIKFQAFVLLGQAIYNSHIEPLLQNKKGSHYNRIKDIELSQLLRYCGVDSLLEYHVAVRQRKEMGYG